MSTVGIVCEYNPFHKGHLYQIEQAKKLTEADHVVCFMSGNFLQRGIPALADKFTRAEAAIKCGVDVYSRYHLSTQHQAQGITPPLPSP